jgi:predicted metalloendopeptidase
MKQFENRTKCVAETMEQFDVPVPGTNLTLHVNGSLVLGESLADLGGIAGAYRAYTHRLANDTAFANSEARVSKLFKDLNATLDNRQLYFVAW